jgi:uncharacterized protein (DUF1499 family)
MSWNQSKFKSTSLGNIRKFNLTQLKKNMVEIIDDQGFKIVHHKKNSLAMRQGMRIGQSNVGTQCNPSFE